MKEVLPALTGQGYSEMEIGDGGTASREYLRVTFNHVPGSERERIRMQLEKYCSLDTSGMIAIVDALVKIAAEPPCSAHRRVRFPGVRLPRGPVASDPVVPDLVAPGSGSPRIR